MTFWYRSKVLVTGANGFAGSSLCKNLIKNEAIVYALVRDDSNLANLADILPKVNLVYGDVRYPETIESAIKGKDYVFNLAAKVNIEETRKNPSETLRTNINGAFNVADACKKHEVKRLVHVSTCHIYGNPSNADLPIKESTIPQPIDVYSISKYAAEFLVNNVQRLGLDAIITRAFNHYGPGQTGDFFVAKVIRHLLNNTSPKLGNNKPTRDYSYVDDITLGYMLAAERGRSGDVYHFASGQEISIGKMFEKIREAIGTNIEPIWQSARENDMSRSYGNFEKAKSELGWSPKVSLEEGLKLTVNWWRKNGRLLSTQI
jgi:nucleoside-diphosphate-sugar epimerase